MGTHIVILIVVHNVLSQKCTYAGRECEQAPRTVIPVDFLNLVVSVEKRQVFRCRDSKPFFKVASGPHGIPWHSPRISLYSPTCVVSLVATPSIWKEWWRSRRHRPGSRVQRVKRVLISVQADQRPGTNKTTAWQGTSRRGLRLSRNQKGLLGKFLPPINKSRRFGAPGPGGQ